MNLILGGVADVTLDKSGGAYSEQTASFLPGVLESSDDLFAVIDPDFKLLLFNSSFRTGIASLLGEGPQLHQRLDDLLERFPPIVNPIIALCQRSFEGESFRLPLEFHGQNGVTRYFDASFNAISDANGVVLVVAIALRDVTDKRIAELKFQGILEATPDAMLFVRHGIIEVANSQLEALFGYARDALKGQPLEMLVPERLRDRHTLQRINFEQNPKARPMGMNLDLLGRKADGSEFPVEISLCPLELNGERYIVAAVRDITARKLLESTLREEAGELRNQLALLQRKHGMPTTAEPYRATFEKAAAALINYGTTSRIQRANSHFCRLLGFTQEELQQRTIKQLTHPSDREINAELDIKLLAGGIDSYQIEKRLLRKDGAVVWMRLFVSLQRDSQDEPDYFIAVATDISERKNMEAIVREAQLRLSLATEIARVGYLELDLQTNESYFSAELQRQLGYADEWPGTFGEWSRRLHPDDRERTTAALQGLIREPTSRLFVEYRLRHKDGRYRWFAGRGIGLEDLPGHACKLIVTQIDITARKHSETQLREQAEELRLALRVGRSGTFEWDVQNRRQRWNDEMLALYGLSSQAFGGHDEDWLACLLPEDRVAALRALEASLANGGEYVSDFRIHRRSDGDIRWVSARGKVLFDEAGKPLRMVGINADVTEARQVQAELEVSEARLQATLNGLSEGVILFDPEGRVIDANPATLEMLEFDSLDALHRAAVDFSRLFELASLEGRVIPIEEWPINRLLRGETFTDESLVVSRKDSGHSMIVCHNGSLIRNPEGGILFGVLTIVDISERKRAEIALKDSERRLALALKASNTAVWEVDVASGTLVVAEDLLFSMLGYARNELRTVADWNERIHEDDGSHMEQLRDDVIQGRREYYEGLELRIQAKDGHWHWILCQMVAAERDADGRATRLVGTHTDIHARKLVDAQALKASQHDPLTGLPGRALVYEYGGHLLAASLRGHNRGALLFIDLDRFKPINDQYGHEIGDRVLQEVGKRLVACSRNEDLVGRLGGDEFVIMLAHHHGARHRTAAVAQHVLERLSEPFMVGDLELNLSPSIGISRYPDDAETMEGLIHTADLAMYQVKQTGRGHYQFYTPELDKRADEMRALETRLKAALKRGHLKLHYQPVMEVKSGRLIAAEALLRLDDGHDETPTPDVFIPVAEATGLIGELGEWVAAEACRQQEIWRNEGLSLTIAINVSPLQFRQRSFPDKLGRIIAEAGIDPGRLELEVTESSVMENVDDAVEILNRIKSLGVKVALDDFGTGYSNLSLLSSLPLDKLKVDQAFVRHIDNDPTSRAVAEAIITLGRNLDLEVIGEGIESEEALDCLARLGCDQVQGFLFSRPLPPSKFEQWIRDRQLP